MLGREAWRKRGGKWSHRDRASIGGGHATFNAGSKQCHEKFQEPLKAPVSVPPACQPGTDTKSSSPRKSRAFLWSLNPRLDCRWGVPRPQAGARPVSPPLVTSHAGADPLLPLRAPVPAPHLGPGFPGRPFLPSCIMLFGFTPLWGATMRTDAVCPGACAKRL